MSKIPYFALLGLSTLCLGDTLTLKNGETVEGTFLGGTARVVRMEIDGKVQSYDVGNVVRIQFNANLETASAPPPPPAEERRTEERRILRPDSSPSYSSSNGNSSGPPQQVDNRDNRAPSSAGMELPAGTPLTVRMIDSVDSQVARLGDTFRASIDEPVIANGETVIPRGADVVAKLVEDEKSGKIQGRTVLKLALVSVRVGDRTVDVTTQDVVKESSSRGSRSGKVIGGTAALGAIIGGIAGGGRGAAIGAGSGAAVGTGAQEVSKAQRIVIPSETRLVFTTSYAVRL